MKSKLVPPIAKFLITVQLSLNNKNSIGLGLSDSTLTLQYHSFDSIATVLLHLSLSLSHLPLFHSFNQESSYLPLQDYTMFQPRMSTSSHISPRRRGIIPEIDFVKWIIHPAWMGKRGGHVRREETWPRDRRFIRSIRRRCDLDVTMGLESIEALHPLPLKGCRKTRPYPVSSTSRVQIGIVRRECNDRGIMHGGVGRGVCVYRETYTVSNGRSNGEQTARGSRQMSWRAAQGRLKTQRKMGERERGRVSWRIERASDQPKAREKQLRMGG